MDKVVAKDYWDSRYAEGGNSGDGSYGEMLQDKIELLSGLDIKSISEIGCGDFNFGSHLRGQYPGVGYVAQDISSVINTRNQQKYPMVTFTTDVTEVPPADLVLCIDVLFHILDDTEYEEILKKLESLWIDYLAITAYEEEQVTSPHMKVRKFDYTRFGDPLVRKTIKGDDKLYFYLFKKQKGIDLSKVSACLNTKENVYPAEVLESVMKYPFGEILIKTHSDSPYCKYELFEKAKYDMLYYQDDDAIVPTEELLQKSKPDMINVGMKQSHFDSYSSWRMTMGLGWGSFFNKSFLASLKKYTDIYGEDPVFKRDTEKLLTHLNFPQNRVVLPIRDLPTAMAPDRISFQPGHYDNMNIIVERCAKLI